MKTTTTQRLGGLLAATAGGLLLAALAARGAMLPGSQPKAWPMNPAKHVTAITREAADDTGRKMIAAAEAAAPGTNAWWCGERNRIRIPYALTHEALAYYTALVQGYKQRAWKAYIEPNSKLEYTAAVARRDAFTANGKTYANVYVVTLKLTFAANFTEDATAGVHFSKERTVVLDAQGTVLKITGDGPTEMPMLAI